MSATLLVGWTHIFVTKPVDIPMSHVQMLAPKQQMSPNDYTMTPTCIPSIFILHATQIF